MLVEKRGLALVNDRVGLIIMTVIFSILVILSTIFRFRARNLTKAGLKIDDWLAVIALVSLIARLPCSPSMQAKMKAFNKLTTSSSSLSVSTASSSLVLSRARLPVIPSS